MSVIPVPANACIPVTVRELRSLNRNERDAIAQALEEYIRNHPDKCWAQSVILTDMLPKMFWGSE